VFQDSDEDPEITSGLKKGGLLIVPIVISIFILIDCRIRRYSLSSERLVDIKITKFYAGKVPTT
jgi:hypothetical protein